MAQVMQIHKVDNGYFIQTIEKEGSAKEGIAIANNMDEVMSLVDAKLREIEGVQKKLEAKAPIKFVSPDGDDGHHLPAGFAPADELQEHDPDDYEAELTRILDDNDRDAAHDRLKVHVDNGVIEPYKPRLGIQNLVSLLREADKKQQGTDGEEDVPPSGATLPSGAPLPPGVPPPTPSSVKPAADPFATEEAVLTIQDVSKALQEAAKRTDALTAFGVLRELGAEKITELDPTVWAEAIAKANNIK
jgi:hypothetical protein